MTDTTNAGPVLPEFPEVPDPTAPLVNYGSAGAGYEIFVREGCQYTEEEVRTHAEAYGLQCWNACVEQVAGPLRERVAELERENAVLAESIALGPGAEAVKSISDELDRLRAENVIEWEPGRSYTAAELLRRAIRGIRVRKGRPLWPAVMNLCGVGSNVGHHLCRWAGRDPDTGADLDAARVAIEGNQ
jgi:hypothetical protein